jgi:serine protease Do
MLLTEKPTKRKLINFNSNTLKANLPLTIIIVSIISGVIGGLGALLFKSEIQNQVTEIGTKNITVNEESATIEVVKKVSPSVVSITSEQTVTDFWGQSQTAESSGTGFIVTADGLIATNKHVARDSRSSYTVFTNDGKEFQATVKATDPYFDIAFLKIEASGLVPLDLGDSENLAVGQVVIAIGNALGQFQNTVTTGVVSAVGRSIAAGDSSGQTETLENMIQTDAAINSGNSGGPLVNIDGQVIGMNTAVAGNAEGIGFATPVNLVKTALASVQKEGRIVRPMLGVRYINITKEIASSNDLPVDHGALIYASGSLPAVVVGSPADKAGLRKDDIIIKIGDKEVKEGRSLVSVLSSFMPGEKVEVKYLREGKEASVTVTLSESK